MPRRKISDLPAVSALSGGELVPVVQGGVTRRATLGSGPGQIPFLASQTGFVLTNNQISTVLNRRISLPSSSNLWFRLAIVSVQDINAFVFYLHFFAYQMTDWPIFPPVEGVVRLSYVSQYHLSLSPVHLSSLANIFTDLAVVQTNADTFEIWARTNTIYSKGISLHARIVQTWCTTSLASGEQTMQASPPSPMPGGVEIYYSTNTSQRLAYGRIVQATSGSNGNSIRFDDGTQIAYHAIASGSFGTQAGAGTFTDPYRRTATWTFPAAFSAAPQVLAVVESTATGVLMARLTSVSATNAGVQVDYAANNAAFTVRLMAIGRWY